MMMRILLIAVFLMGVVALAFPDVLGVDIRPLRQQFPHRLQVIPGQRLVQL